MSYELHYTGYGYPSMEQIEEDAESRGLIYSYWASEYGYAGFYNGDTVVVYDNTDGMDEGMLEDADNFGQAIAERRKENAERKARMETLRKEWAKERGEEYVPLEELKEKPVSKKSLYKRFDSANYTRRIQIASEAATGIKFNGAKKATTDYDGKDNNPADVMAGWDDYNEMIKDSEQQERNLQHMVDEKGYHMPEIEKTLKQELEQE